MNLFLKKNCLKYYNDLFNKILKKKFVKTNGKWQTKVAN